MREGNQRLLITISRQMGSGGSYIGQRLSKRLGIKYVDRDILRRTMEYLGEDEKQLEFREERVSGLLENFLRGFIHGSPEAAYLPPPIRPVYDPELFKTEALVIQKIAGEHDSVIVGRAAFHVLRGRSGLISVFLHAPEEFRIKRLMELYRISGRSEAAELVRESDKERGRFIKTVSGMDWNNSLCYHLCIDTAFAGLDAAEEIITTLVEKVRGA
ncbi:MAG: cytidylate kinase-like family protein [Nitrospiraceae bacterium]|nr:cytidylate kinase-like family protein [Nitrospiraceae bacterium]